MGRKIKEITDKKEKYSTGVLYRYNGTLISLSNPDKRILITIPPVKDIDTIFHQSYWKNIQKVSTNEEYNEIILIGEIPKEVELDDGLIKCFSEKELAKEFYKYIETQ